MRLGPRLFLLVVLSSLLPASLILVAGWLQLRQQMRLWTIPSVETALESSLETNRKAFDRLQRQLEMEGRVVAESRVFPPAPDDTTGLTAILQASCREYGCDLAQWYQFKSGGFRLLNSRTLVGPGGPDGATLLGIPAGSAIGPRRVAPLRMQDGRDDFLAIPTYLWKPAHLHGDSAELRGALVLGISLGPRYYARLGEVGNGLFFYRRLEEVGVVLRTGYGLLAGIVLLVSVGFSLWMARKVAGSVSRPVEDLVRGMEAVGTAGYDSGSPDFIGGTGGGSQIPEIARLAHAFALMRAALCSYEERLRESERIRGAQETSRFVAHEIRNTLTPVKASLSVLERQVSGLTGESKDRADRALGLIRREADRMTSLAGAFSEYAQFPKRKPVPCDLGEMLEALAATEIPPRIQWEFRRLEGHSPVIADRDEMERIFRNLIKNAVESIPDSGTIRMSLARNPAGDRIEISLEDSGNGIDPDTMHKIFQVGFTTKETGTGLGLALVRSSLSHYGGVIRMESEPGRGTRCTILLPLAVVSEEEAPRGTATQSDGQGGVPA